MLEELWAEKAFQHAEVYFNVSAFGWLMCKTGMNYLHSDCLIFQLLCSVDPRLLNLTPFDDQIYRSFREDFPTFNVGLIDDNELKCPAAKEKWRAFIEKFNKLDDYSFGTLIRADASEEFSPTNSLLVIRLQFWAIEVARNREGHNDKIRYRFKSQLTASEESKQ